MNIVIFGLAVSSSWGNGHATLWRGLIKALARRGHRVTFFERDVPYYASHRDLHSLPGGELVLYSDWNEIAPRARRHIAEADVAMVTSYCPDARIAASHVLDANTLRVFYDLDTPVTLAQLDASGSVDYLPVQGLGDFDLVLSYTGGRALDELTERLGARRVAPLFGSVDPDVHRPLPAVDRFSAHASYLGTYAADRQEGVSRLFLEPARRLLDQTFIIGGSLYPADFPWAANIKYVPHVAPNDHSAFYCSSRVTLNVTREAMARMGWCPSGRLFEAAACGVPVVSDDWRGLDAFFAPGEEILVARDTEEAVAALQMSPRELQRIGRNARERTLDEHTADRRAVELEHWIDSSGRARAASVRTHRESAEPSPTGG